MWHLTPTNIHPCTTPPNCVCVGSSEREFRRIDCMQNSPPWKANSHSASQDFFALRKTRHFTASSKYLVKRNCPRWTHATLWWKILWSYTLILTSILDYSPIWPFFSYSHTKILSKLLIPFQTCYMTRSPHFPYLTNIIMCEKGYELGRLSLCIFLWLPFTWISYLAN